MLLEKLERALIHSEDRRSTFDAAFKLPDTKIYLECTICKLRQYLLEETLSGSEEEAVIYNACISLQRILDEGVYPGFQGDSLFKMLLPEEEGIRKLELPAGVKDALLQQHRIKDKSCQHIIGYDSDGQLVMTKPNDSVSMLMSKDIILDCSHNVEELLNMTNYYLSQPELASNPRLIFKQAVFKHVIESNLVKSGKCIHITCEYPETISELPLKIIIEVDSSILKNTILNEDISVEHYTYKETE